ncbi:type I-C CRISPR-associated protein Cas8c/Csd1 [Couchioplanes caeruleus]|uniref:Type I-C CRISPR-associated protein Cas8c/Csd1 n=2 Tax=Couchioplanes caeruleus TaxID=56438 RepID=A0A1K0FNU6_9ACTN|nr:type I-C CRISPR-associated protein Cas8c/Csd1 [Couchioplanes caeruleus]OJF14511.1 type I-C CRISPR-associated protein Cas8c/Csd1 [Couchioplanes caeruleus subsp. caeruleus]ROP21220.1 CRISPR-associated Csd1 family protein [Couchioplanes caeruleus]
MLLQRLVEFADASGEVVPPFYARKAVRWLLDLHPDGTVAGPLTDTADPSDRARKYGVARLVPSVTRTVGIAPALAVDNPEYVLGWIGEGSNPERAPKQHAAFKELIYAWDKHVGDPRGPAHAIAEFYRHQRDASVDQPPGWGRGDLVAFRVAGTVACTSEAAIGYWATVAAARKGSGAVGLCLVCARVQPLLKTIPQQIPSRWLPGTLKNASLVSVNEAVHGYELKKSLVHTPICTGCALKFTSALTTLLSDPNHSVAYSGQNTRLAWWIVGGADYDPMGALEQPNDADVPQLLAAVRGGSHTELDDTSAFCTVTVAGNSARVVVRGWVQMPLPQLKANIAAWLTDLEMVDAFTGAPTRIPLGHLTRVSGRWDTRKSVWKEFGASGEDRPHGAHRALLAAALLGRPLPPHLLTHVIHRIRADRRVDTARAALIRLILRRHPRIPAPDRKALMATLNPDHPSPAYLAGRIFAVLEDLQLANARAYNQSINTTFADRYFSRAITSPLSALVAGRRDARAWLKRLRRVRPKSAYFYEQRLDELFNQIADAGGIPAAVVVVEQAAFILGYHQQRAATTVERQQAKAASGAIDPDLDVDSDDTALDIDSSTDADTEGVPA